MMQDEHSAVIDPDRTAGLTTLDADFTWQPLVLVFPQADAADWA